MPASKKRVQITRDAPASLQSAHISPELRNWVHKWHGVRIDTNACPQGSSETGRSGRCSAASCRNDRVIVPGVYSKVYIFALSCWQLLRQCKFKRQEKEPLVQSPCEEGDACYYKSEASIIAKRKSVRLWDELMANLPDSQQSLFSTLQTIQNPRKRYKDFLYVLLNMHWPMLISALMGLFLLMIVFFTLLYEFACGEPRTLLESFDLTYQTFSTVGFGIVSPTNTCSNMMSVIVSFVSMLLTSAITGLIFAKFAKPRAKIAYSQVCAIQPYGKKYLALIIRVANATQSRDVTHDVIMEANFRLNLLRIESSSQIDKRDTGIETLSKNLSFYQLKLLQNNFITLRMSVAVVHLIDEQSPLYGMSELDIEMSDMVLEVAMCGVDSTLQDTVTARHVYSAKDVKWGYRFAELLDFDEANAEIVMDFGRLSMTVAAPIDEKIYVVRQSERRDVLNSGSNAEEKRAIAVTNDNCNTAKLKSKRRASVARENLSHAPEGCNLFSLNGAHNDASTDLGIRKQRVHRSASLGRSNFDPPMRTFSMEPLFEPLLKAPVGTQRISIVDGNVTNNSQRFTDKPLVVPRPRKRELSGDNDTFVAPSARQMKALQLQLAGDADCEEENDCLDITRERDRERASNAFQDSIPFMSEDQQCDSIVDNSALFAKERDQSDTSMGLHDTPRFLRIRPIHIPQSFSFMHLYHSALYQRWPRIIFIMILGFVGINLIFAVLFWLDYREFVVNKDVKVTRFEQAFYMSVHTLATVGYGSIAPAPKSVYLNFCVLIESVVGLVTLTIITGIAWSKFARPRAHIHFTSNIVIAEYNGYRCLLIRAANTRHSGDVHENSFRMGVILTDNRTGLRQIYDVPLVAPEWPSIKLPATLIHVIDEDSLFCRFRSIEDLANARVSVIVLMTGLDATFAENVYARKMYFWDDFVFDRQFSDFATVSADGITVNFAYFDRLLPENTLVEEDTGFSQDMCENANVSWQFV